ncbi:hypothetical protein H4R34_002983 [Dimargaris verticillata]|uniref:RRM domain-containing protein n=1 Tax=Dimargaris verticillata TaxID=2761393 RepID=A0A9W8B737_9FUNG|nr:hypothetical protein H4R34_002983 [Dimargaris verticillata]
MPAPNSALDRSLDDIIESSRDSSRSRRHERSHKPYQQSRRQRSDVRRWDHDLYRESPSGDGTRDDTQRSALVDTAYERHSTTTPTPNMAPRTTRSVLVDNLSRKADEDTLEREFRQAGPVDKVVLQYDTEGYPLGQAVVTFRSVEDATQAQLTLDGERIHALSMRSIHVRPFYGRAVTKPRASNIAITGASSVFSRLGGVEAPPVDISLDALRQQSRANQRSDQHRHSQSRRHHHHQRSSNSRNPVHNSDPAATKNNLDREMDEFMKLD